MIGREFQYRQIRYSIVIYRSYIKIYMNSIYAVSNLVLIRLQPSFSQSEILLDTNILKILIFSIFSTPNIKRCSAFRKTRYIGNDYASSMLKHFRVRFKHPRRGNNTYLQYILANGQIPRYRFMNEILCSLLKSKMFSYKLFRR